MTRRMDWRKAQLHRKPTWDHRWHEFNPDLPDRADKWLQAVECRQRERRTLTATRRQSQSGHRGEQ